MPQTNSILSPAEIKLFPHNTYCENLRGRYLSLKSNSNMETIPNIIHWSLFYASEDWSKSGSGSISQTTQTNFL